MIVDSLLGAQQEAALYRLYREFFHLAERKRRWSLDADIPWSECNRADLRVLQEGQRARRI